MEKHLEAIELFSQNLLSANDINSIINKGLNVYTSILELSLATVFLFDPSTFEPILTETYPLGTEEQASQSLDVAIDFGLLSETMNSNSPVFKEFEGIGSIILAPLISTRGALGFVLLQPNLQIDLIDDRIKLIIHIFSNYFATSLNNLNLENENKSYINKKDQLVALQTQELLEQKKEISEKVEQLKSSLLMTLPHEVRTPLNQILGLTDFLKNSLDELEADETKEILEDVHSSAVRLRRLFENYLYLSTLIITAYDLEELEELQKSVVYSAESLIYEVATNLSYAYNKPDSIILQLEGASLHIKEEHFNKLIYELVDNAYKFTQREPKFKISSTIKDDSYIINIEDNGIGLPLEKIYMLDAYIQFDRLKNEQQGSGLGLAIVKRIVEIYRGEISFKSEAGISTKVKIKLPIASINEDEL